MNSSNKFVLVAFNKIVGSFLNAQDVNAFKIVKKTAQLTANSILRCREAV